MKHKSLLFVGLLLLSMLAVACAPAATQAPPPAAPRCNRGAGRDRGPDRCACAHCSAQSVPHRRDHAQRHQRRGLQPVHVVGAAIGAEGHGR